MQEALVQSITGLKVCYQWHAMLSHQYHISLSHLNNPCLSILGFYSVSRSCTRDNVLMVCLESGISLWRYQQLLLCCCPGTKGNGKEPHFSSAFHVVFFWFCFKLSRMWSPIGCCFCRCRKWREGLREVSVLLLLLPTLWPDLGQADLMLKLDTSAAAALCSGLCFQISDIWRTANLVLSRSLCTFLSLTSPAPWSLALTDPRESPIYPIPFPISYHMLPVFLLMSGATRILYAGVLNISNFSSSLTKFCYWKWA